MRVGQKNSSVAVVSLRIQAAIFMSMCPVNSRMIMKTSLWKAPVLLASRRGSFLTETVIAKGHVITEKGQPTIDLPRYESPEG